MLELGQTDRHTYKMNKYKKDSDMLFTGLYAAGWLATGPVGVILSTMTQAFGVGRAIEADIRSGRVDVSCARPGHVAVAKLLNDRGV